MNKFIGCYFQAAQPIATFGRVDLEMHSSVLDVTPTGIARGNPGIAMENGGEVALHRNSTNAKLLLTANEIRQFEALENVSGADLREDQGAVAPQASYKFPPPDRRPKPAHSVKGLPGMVSEIAYQQLDAIRAYRKSIGRPLAGDILPGVGFVRN